MTRARWTRTANGYALNTDSASVVLWRTQERSWLWSVFAGCPMVRLGEADKPTRTAKTAARHALAWVREHLSPIVDAARDAPGEMP